MLSRRHLLLTAPAILLPNRATAWVRRGSASSGGLLIQINYTTNALATGTAPFFAGVQSAANLIQAAFSNPVTINITVGLDENGVPFAGGQGEPSSSGPSSDYQSVARPTLIAAANASGNATFISASNALPNTSTYAPGVSFVLFARAVSKILGLHPTTIHPRDTTEDGRVDFSSAIPSGNLVGAVLHEITHAMGRFPGGGFNLTHFISSGVRDASQQSGDYFSLDNGVTNLCYYDFGHDPSDWATSANGLPLPYLDEDAFSWQYNSSTPQTLSTIDIQQMNAMGFV